MESLPYQNHDTPSVMPRVDSRTIASVRRFVVCAIALLSIPHVSLPSRPVDFSFLTPDQAKVIKIGPKKDPLCRKWYNGDEKVWHCLCDSDEDDPDNNS